MHLSERMSMASKRPHRPYHGNGYLECPGVVEHVPSHFRLQDSVLD